jgi:hypothetical protein
MGRSASGTRDPLVGRAILAGVLAGALVLLPSVLGLVSFASREGVPAVGDIRGIHGLLGQREVWSLVLERVTWAVIEGLSLTFLMVVARLGLRRPVPSAVLAAVLWLAPDIGFVLASESRGIIPEVALQLVTVVTVMILVLLRWGLVGLIAMQVTGFLGDLAPTSDWSAWHAEPGIVCTLLIAALAGYGCWAATPGQRKHASVTAA